jgi:5,10-methylenetetrahydromethanopterin reductase
VRTSIWLFPDHPVSEIVAAAVAAERAGLSTFWIGDEGVAREPFAVLTAVGLATQSIGLGVAVANPYLRHPALTASTAATVAEATGRRLHLGFGPGGAASLNPVGLHAVDPVPRLRGALRIARAVLKAEPTDGFDPGPFARPEPRVDLWIGARGLAIASMAGLEADGFFTSLTKPMLGSTLARVRAKRDVPVALCFPLILNDVELEQFRPYSVFALLDAPAGTPEAAGMSRSDAEAAASAVAAGDLLKAASYVSDEAVRNVAIVGEATEAASEFAQLGKQHRAAEIVAAVWGDDLPGKVEKAAEVLLSARAQATG